MSSRAFRFIAFAASIPAPSPFVCFVNFVVKSSPYAFFAASCLRVRSESLFLPPRDRPLYFVSIVCFVVKFSPYAFLTVICFAMRPSYCVWPFRRGFLPFASIVCFVVKSALKLSSRLRVNAELFFWPLGTVSLHFVSVVNFVVKSSPRRRSFLCRLPQFHVFPSVPWALSAFRFPDLLRPPLPPVMQVDLSRTVAEIACVAASGEFIYSLFR